MSEQDRIDPWWKTKDDPGPELSRKASELWQSPHEGLRRDYYRDYARLYCNQELRSLNEWSASHHGMDRWINPAALSWNVAQAASDAILARLFSKVPGIQVLTKGGNYEQQKRGQLLTEFVDGLHYENNYAEVAWRSGLDTLAFDGGARKFSPSRSRATVLAERVFPWHVLIDPVESMRGDPRSMIEVREVPGDWVIDEFELTGQSAAIVKDTTENGRVRLAEGWKLPTGKDSDGSQVGGFHCVALASGKSGLTLDRGPWMHDFFPILLHPWDMRFEGCWGQGLIEQLVPYQLELNRGVHAIRNSQKIAAVPRWAMQKGSEITDGMLNNDIGSVIEYVGQAPQMFTATAMNAEAYNWMETIWRRAFEQAGLSLLSATGAKPAGLNSGEAQRVYRDIETDRFAMHAQRWDANHVQAVRIEIAMAKQLYQDNPEMRVRAPATKLLNEIKFSDVQMDEDAWMIRPQPVNSFGSTPAARLDRATDLWREGLIDEFEFRGLIEWPDDQAVLRLRNAPYREITFLLDRIVDKGDYEAPDRFMNLKLAIKMGTERIARAREQEVGSKKIGMLQDWVDEAAALLAGPAPAPRAVDAGLIPEVGAAPAPPTNGAAAPTPGADLLGLGVAPGAPVA